MHNHLNIFDFNDYRKYLKKCLEIAKKNKTFNLSRLAEATQVHPTFLSHVLKGEKSLSLEQAALVSDQLALSKLEKDYFFLLINLDRAGTTKLREYWMEKKQTIENEKNKLSQRFDEHRELTPEQRSIFYSSWIYVAAWACSAIGDGQSKQQIANHLHLESSTTEQVLNFLVQTGLCSRNNGKYTMTETHVHVPNESPLVVKHHTNWRLKAMNKMDFREPSELFFTAPMSIAKKDFDQLREKLNVMIKECVELAKNSPAEHLVCLNIDFFRSIRGIKPTFAHGTKYRRVSLWSISSNFATIWLDLQ